MFSLLELKTPTDRLQSECDVRFICVKNEKLCKIRKRYYSKKRKENSNYGFLSVFLHANCEKYTKNTCVNGVKNVAKNIEKELFGYKLNGKMIETKQTYKNAVNADCRSAECQRALAQSTCNAGGGWTDLLDEKEFEISQLRFDWLKAGKGIEIKLAGNLATHKHIQYETSLVVSLLNQEE